MSCDFNYYKPQDVLPELGERVLVFMRHRETRKLVPSVGWLVYDERDRKNYWEFHHGWRMEIDGAVVWMPIEIPDVPEDAATNQK